MNKMLTFSLCWTSPVLSICGLLLVICHSLLQCLIDGLLRLVERKSEVAFTAILPVVHRCHKDTSTTLWGWTFPPETLDLPVPIHLVELQHSQFGLLALMLDLFRCGVNLLLALLSPTTESEDKMESRFLLDVVVGESTAIFELFAGEDQALLIGWNALLV
jgi:hypothetical protein